MPSVTSISQFTLTNLGPLTTTWTAPQSCAARTSQVYLAPTGIPDAPYYSKDCSRHLLGDCYPGGASQIDSIFNASESIFFGGPKPYYSPGLFCPDSWTTAGIAVKDDNGKLLSSSGLFAPTTLDGITIGPGPVTITETLQPTRVVTTTVVYTPRSNPGWNIFMEALAPSETAVVCCPSSYTVAFDNICYSNLAETAFTGTTECQRVFQGDFYTTINNTFTYNSIVVTGKEWIQTKTASLEITTPTITIPTTALTRYTGLVYVHIPTLVHKQGDTANAAPRVRIERSVGLYSGLAVVWIIAILGSSILPVWF